MTKIDRECGQRKDVVTGWYRSCDAAFEAACFVMMIDDLVIKSDRRTAFWKA